MNTFQSILNAILGAVNFTDDALEGPFKAVYEAGGKAMQAAIRVDAAKGQEDVAGELEGLVELANTFAGADLSPAQTDSLKAAVAKIVKKPDNPELEAALEETFNAVLDAVNATLLLNEVVDAYNPPDETEG